MSDRTATSRLRRACGWLARQVRRRLPYHCRVCGGPLRRVRAGDFPPGVLEMHRLAHTLYILLDYGHLCPAGCTGEKHVVLIA